MELVMAPNLTMALNKTYLQTIIKEEGYKSLWKGLTPFATHLTLKYALRMGSNSLYQVGAYVEAEVGAEMRA